MTVHQAGDVLLHVARINADRGYRFYDEREPLNESVFADVDESELRGELYRAGVREYGRCISKVYVDRRDADALHVGYVFLKRETYEDTGDPYLCETWVSVERVVEPAHPTVIESVAL